MLFKVLFIDDFYEDFEKGLIEVFGQDSIIFQKTPSLEKILETLSEQQVKVAILDDVYVIDAQGRQTPPQYLAGDLARGIKNKYPHVAVIVLSAYLKERETENGLKPPADAIFQKPEDPKNEEFYNKLHFESEYLVDVLNVTDWDKEMEFVVGTEPKLVEIAKRIKKFHYNPEPLTILIKGESGTGKEMVSRAIYRKSPPPYNKSCQIIHCKKGEPPRDFLIKLAGYPPYDKNKEILGKLDFLEIQKKETQGKQEVICGGTLVIDEIESLNLESQNSLNRLLERQGVEQLDNPRKIFCCKKTRFIITTNRDLAQMVKNGDFRGDLWNRINRHPIDLPPLCEIKSVIPSLFRHFVKKYGGAAFDASLRKNVLRVLESYNYEGNIREFERLIEETVRNTTNNTIFVENIKRSAERLGLEEAERTNISVEGLVSEIMQKKIRWSYINKDLGFKEKGESTKNLLIDLAQRICRKKGQITQKLIAEYLGVSPSYAGKLLCTNNLTIKALRKMFHE